MPRRGRTRRSLSKAALPSAPPLVSSCNTSGLRARPARLGLQALLPLSRGLRARRALRGLPDPLAPRLQSRARRVRPAARGLQARLALLRLLPVQRVQRAILDLLGLRVLLLLLQGLRVIRVPPAQLAQRVQLLSLQGLRDRPDLGLLVRLGLRLLLLDLRVARGLRVRPGPILLWRDQPARPGIWGLRDRQALRLQLQALRVRPDLQAQQVQRLLLLGLPDPQVI
mgnify:CR=1 FL=1